MKKRLLLVLASVGIAFHASAQKLPYVVDPTTKKHVTYHVATDGTYKTTFSNGKVGYPTIDAVDFKKVYASSSVPIVITPPVIVPPAAPAQVWTVVTPNKDGQLIIDGLHDVNIKIGLGKVNYIFINKPINVKIDGGAADLNNGTIDIADASNIELFNLSIHDQPIRAINIRGFSNDVYLHDITFKNIGDYVISYENHTNYDGTDLTASKNWKLEKLSFENTSVGFHSDASYDDDGIKNVMKNFKFLNCTIKNCPIAGNVVWLAACDGYEVAGNTVNNFNTVYPDPNAPNGYHNGVFHLWGNGSFHDNKFTNFQGNTLRAWTVSYGSTAGTVSIYNNIAYNTFKYGAFELQATPEIQAYLSKYPKRISVANAKVYNNTAGHLNLVHDWEGQMLDLYNTGGTLEYYNNLGFDMVKVQGSISDMINNMSDTKIIKNTGNKYFPTQAAAVSDITAFKSLSTGIGAQ